MYLFDMESLRGVAAASPLLVDESALVRVRKGAEVVLFITDIDSKDAREIDTALQPLYGSVGAFFGICHLSLPVYCRGEWREMFRGNVRSVVTELSPAFTVCMGNSAVDALLSDSGFSAKAASMFAGACIPSPDLNTHIIPTFGIGGDSATGVLVRLHLNRMHSPREALPEPKIVLDDSILYSLKPSKIYAFDYETSGLKPYNDGHFIYSMSICEVGSDETYSFLVTDDNRDAIKAFLSDGNYRKVAHNLKMEDKWSRVILGTPVRGWVWDTCLAAHCINSFQMSGLKFQVFLNFGVRDYSTEVDKYLIAPDANSLNNIKSAPIKELLTYGALDAYYTAKLYPRQYETLSSWKNTLPHSDDFVTGTKFFSAVQQAFSVMESNGLKFDADGMVENEDWAAAEKQSAIEKFEATELYSEWKRAFGAVDLGSPTQLKSLLFDILGHKSSRETKKGDRSVDVDALTELGIPDLDHFIQAKKYDKTIGTYYAQFRREMSDKGMMHCEMMLNTTVTFRTSCTNPNLQNITARDKEQSKLIRRLFLPHHSDWCIVEADLKGCEVSGAACHTRDKNLMAYVSDSSLDMHRDIAEKIFHVPGSQISREVRSIIKVYTFGSFYGSFWKLTGPHIYRLLKMQNPAFSDGTPVLKHLESLGLGTEDAFTESVQDADNHFWRVLFPGYDDWKDTTYKNYLRQGYVDLFTGFRRWGPMSRNQVINSPIQGDSSHINLWLCRYVLSQIARRGLPAKPALQIHDSVLGTVHKSHVREYCEIFNEGIAELKGRWKWMVCPFNMEFEVAPPGLSWYDKQEFKL